MKLVQRMFAFYSQFVQSDHFVRLAGVNAVIGSNITILQDGEGNLLAAGVLGACTGVAMAFMSPILAPLGVLSLPAICYNAYKK